MPMAVFLSILALLPPTFGLRRPGMGIELHPIACDVTPAYGMVAVTFIPRSLDLWTLPPSLQLSLAPRLKDSAAGMLPASREPSDLDLPK